MQRVIAEIRQRRFTDDPALSVDDADLAHTAVHQRKLCSVFEHRHAVCLRTLAAGTRLVFQHEFLFRVKNRQSALVCISDAAIRQPPRIIDAAMPRVFQQVGDLARTIDFNDLIVRSEKEPLLGMHRERKNQPEDAVNGWSECIHG